MITLFLQYKCAHKTLVMLRDCLNSLDETRDTHLYEMFQDVAIKRFDYMYTFWRFLDIYLEVVHQVKVPEKNFNMIAKECFNKQIITASEYEYLLQMIGDRGLISYAYNKEIAAFLVERIKSHAELMDSVLKRLKPPLDC